MKTFKISFFMVVLVMAIAIATTLSETLPLGAKGDTENDQDMPTSLGGTSRFRSYGDRGYRPGLMTCDRYPKICRIRGSPGRDCCYKRCVDTRTDRFNCGRCGKRCRYSQICCKGKCVNPMFDKKHCGGCFNKCKKGTSCAYGMCSYA